MSQTSTQPIDVTTLRDWLTGRIAEFTERPPAEIAVDKPLGEYGVDSVSALTVCAEIEDHFDITVEPTLLWDHPTIDAIAEALVDEVNAR